MTSRPSTPTTTITITTTLTSASASASAGAGAARKPWRGGDSGGGRLGRLVSQGSRRARRQPRTARVRLDELC